MCSYTAISFCCYLQTMACEEPFLDNVKMGNFLMHYGNHDDQDISAAKKEHAWNLV